MNDKWSSLPLPLTHLNWTMCEKPLVDYERGWSSCQGNWPNTRGYVDTLADTLADTLVDTLMRMQGCKGVPGRGVLGYDQFGLLYRTRARLSLVTHNSQFTTHHFTHNSRHSHTHTLYNPLAIPLYPNPGTPVACGSYSTRLWRTSSVTRRAIS